MNVAREPLFRTGERVAGRYRVERVLGMGQSGDVYEVQDLELKLPIALKALRSERLGDPTALERFRREITLARRVSHPNVCRVHDLFEEFCRAFHQADVLLVTEIYAAGEDPVGEVSGRKLAEGIERHGHRRVRYVPDLEEAFSALKDEMVEGDLVMTLGAGSVTGLSDRLAEEVRERAR